MAYRRSIYRKDFDSRIDTLRRASVAANRSLSANSTGLRDMVFHCAIFQTSAAMEVYLRLSLEGWFFHLKQINTPPPLPTAVKARIADVRLRDRFKAVVYSNDETGIEQTVADEAELWRLLQADIIPVYFTGAMIHEKSTYPSWQNVIRVLRRVGVNNPKTAINSRLHADGEAYIEAFQSIRTAIAHANPPQIQLADVKDRLEEMKRFIGVLDRVFHIQVMACGGTSCWITQ